MRSDRIMEHDKNLYVKETNGWPVHCEKCGQETRLWVVDMKTRMNLPYCGTCLKVPEEGWRMWEERARSASDYERNDDEFQNIPISLFEDNLSARMKEGFTRTIAYRHAVDDDRKHAQRTVSSDHLVVESGHYSFHPTADQLIDLNTMILRFWDRDLMKRPFNFRAVFCCVLYGTELLQELCEEVRERVLDVIDQLPRAPETDTHKERAELLGFSIKDKALKSYWKTYLWVEKHWLNVLTQSGIIAQVKVIHDANGRVVARKVTM